MLNCIDQLFLSCFCVFCSKNLLFKINGVSVNLFCYVDVAVVSKSSLLDKTEWLYSLFYIVSLFILFSILKKIIEFFSSFHACFTFSLTFLCSMVVDAGESGGLKKGNQTIAKMQMRSDINFHVQVPLLPASFLSFSPKRLNL